MLQENTLMAEHREIERKFKIQRLPGDLTQYASHRIVQAYLSAKPVIRIRKQDDDYILTYKGSGMLSREEYNLPLTKEAFEHLLPKCDGNVISKTRYLIPLASGSPEQEAAPPLTAELDIFDAPFDGLMIVEVEFPDEDAAAAFRAPEWFGEEVTYDRRYHNATLAMTVRGEAESSVDIL